MADDDRLDRRVADDARVMVDDIGNVNVVRGVGIASPIQQAHSAQSHA
ncbi:hypothetical protein [Mycobacterium paraffinicum]|nr:hypothetical protein [Mycobacterium paraffinicum]